MPSPKKSEAERELTGNAGHHAKTQPTPPQSIVGTAESAQANPLGDPPKGLTAKAKRMWSDAAPALMKINLLTAADRIEFGRYCEWLGRYMELQKAAGRKLKAVETTESKSVKMTRVDKTFQVLLLLDKRLMEYEDRFGMNPTSRQAIFARLASGFQPGQGSSAPDPTKGADAKHPHSPIGVLASGSARVQ